ncbi:MAG: hypothetical protein IH619_00370 [Ignavibacterium sp.]|nr:hypothetical protein [Ignavibacterium sp.]
MKTYTIINSDIMHNGKLFPEGSTINLDDKDAQSLSDYLTEIKEVSKNNSDQKTNNKRSK